MTNSQYYNYMEELARQLKDIQHKVGGKVRFAQIKLTEILEEKGAEQLDLTGFCLTADTYDGSLNATNADQIRNNRLGDFMIIKHVPDTDVVSISITLEQALKIGLQVCAKIHQDKENYFSGTASAIKDFDINSVRYEEVGPLFDRAYGYHFEFLLPNPDTLLIDPEMWL